MEQLEKCSQVPKNIIKPEEIIERDIIRLYNLIEYIFAISFPYEKYNLFFDVSDNKDIVQFAVRASRTDMKDAMLRLYGACSRSGI